MRPEENEILVDGIFIDLRRQTEIAADGDYADRGWTLYGLSGGEYLLRKWSNWQGEGDSYSTLTYEGARDIILELSERHADRAAESLRKLAAHAVSSQNVDIEGLRRRCRDSLNKTDSGEAILLVAGLLHCKI